MSFNSIQFFIFFIIVVIANYIVSRQYRWIIGLLGSLIFYAIIDIKALVILIGSSYFDYKIAINIENCTSQKKKKKYLIFSIIVNISLIFGFKYINLFNSTAIQLINLILDKNISITYYYIIIPAGISFYCFKKISYIVDIYKGITEHEKNFGCFLLYTSHFLEILAGPIDRSKDLMAQLKRPFDFDEKNILKGAMLVLWGLFMKVCIADRLAIYSDAVFNNVVHHYGLSFIIAMYFYAFQIYCDFAGYTYMALGFGKIIGIEFKPNFNLPYFATSISDFWRKWHMTLSYWFRDYLYIPLGGSRVSTLRRYYNLMIVFLLTGLWHGSNWTFVVWGGIHALYLIFSIATKKYREIIIKTTRLKQSVLTIIKIIITFNFICFSWIFFRANTLTDAWYIVSHLFKDWPRVFIDTGSMSYGVLGIMVLLFIEILQYKKKISLNSFFEIPILARWCVFYMLIFSIILTGVDSDSAFIYFQF